MLSCFGRVDTLQPSSGKGPWESFGHKSAQALFESNELPWEKEQRPPSPHILPRRVVVLSLLLFSFCLSFLSQEVLFTLLSLYLHTCHQLKKIPPCEEERPAKVSVERSSGGHGEKERPIHWMSLSDDGKVARSLAPVLVGSGSFINRETRKQNKKTKKRKKDASRRREREPRPSRFLLWPSVLISFLLRSGFPRYSTPIQWTGTTTGE